MKRIFVNLKRFDVPGSMGGICPVDNPKEWIERVIDECIKSGIGRLEGMDVTFLLPESLIIPAVERLKVYDGQEVKSINIGCQGVFREDIAKGGNFGAFTTNRPAAAVRNMGCSWAIIGHSEERKDIFGVISKYDSSISSDEKNCRKARSVVDSIINEEVICAVNSGINVLMCLGETAEERGEGDFEEQKVRVESVLRSQLEAGLKGIEIKHPHDKIVIGYEPIWAIGPGKIPPGQEYISFVSSCIKKIANDTFGFDPLVVYGGGLKEENAGMISNIDTIDGGLVALTRFSGEIGFFPEDLRRIIDKYIEA